MEGMKHYTDIDGFSIYHTGLRTVDIDTGKPTTGIEVHCMGKNGRVVCSVAIRGDDIHVRLMDTYGVSIDEETFILWYLKEVGVGMIDMADGFGLEDIWEKDCPEKVGEYLSNIHQFYAIFRVGRYLVFFDKSELNTLLVYAARVDCTDISRANIYAFDGDGGLVTELDNGAVDKDDKMLIETVILSHEELIKSWFRHLAINSARSVTTKVVYVDRTEEGK